MATLLELGRSYAELPPEQLAGQLVMTSYPDKPVPVNQFRSLLRDHGLDESLVPEKRPEVFDFQAACRSVETRRGVAANGRQMVAVGEVVTNQTESVYQITAEARDEANRVIEHRKGMRVIYDKARANDPVVGGDPIRFEPIDSQTLYQSLSALADKINLRFRLTRGQVPGPKVREIMRNELRGMHGARWRDSVWFVGMSHASEVEKWRQVITALSPDAEFIVTPLPNTASVRETVGKKMGEHVTNEATTALGKIADVLGKNEKLTQKQFERLNAIRRDIAAHAEEMQKLYGDEIATVTSAMGLMDQQMMEAWGRVA